MTGYDILRPVIDRLDIDLIHHPFNYLNPAGCRVPAVVTFVDIQQEYHPEFFTEQVLRWRRVHYRRASREASRIIAISDHVKRTIVERYDVSTEMIDVIHLGHGSEFRPIEDSASLETVRRKYRLDRPFMYYPAGTWPHKNHKRLLAAVKLLKERRLFDGMLVLTGIKMQAHREVISEIERLGLKRDVVVLGYLPESELPCLYNLARVLVFPSLFEGFGIPLVEAMASGCPVVCADVTSIPEIVGDAGVYFDPLSVEMIADRVWAVWSDDVMRTAMVRRGLERAKLFDWEQTARKTVASYSRALGV
jgi:glycosyltransferase involved in cell wall biosynthesis